MAVRFAARLPHFSVALALTLGGALSPVQAQGTDPHEAVAEFLPSCAPRFAEVDARIEKAGVGDASYFRVEGFPYLRTDRLMASFDRELDNPDALEAWMLQLRDNDNFSRDIELRNLGLSEQERATLLLDLRLCAVWMSFMEMGEPARIARLKHAVGAAAAEAKAQTAQRKAAASTKPSSEIVIWKTDADAEESARLLEKFERLPEDPLQRKGMTTDGWQALAAHFAPAWMIERSGHGDDPGQLRWKGSRLIVDAAQPTIYFLPTYARVGDRTLLQFSYFLWFATSETDATDGLVWRVTLDLQGRPLLYDGLLADGSTHRFFPAQGLTPRSTGDATVSTEIVGIGPIDVHLSTGAHTITKLEPAQSEDERPSRRYALVRYEDLMTLPHGKGTRSAFDASGRLHGSHRNASAWQWGRLVANSTHTVAADDPRLIEAYFERPANLQGRDLVMHDIESVPQMLLARYASSP